MGTATYPLTFARTNLTASLTDSLLGHGDAAAAAPEEALVPFPGDIVALSVAGNADRTAGTATFEIMVNGVKIASPVAVIDATNPRRLLVTIGHEGLRTIKAGDRISLPVTTSADWAPATIEFAADVWCTVGSYAPG